MGQYGIVVMRQQGQGMTKAINVIAAVNKVQTLADGGIRWTFDLPESAILQSAHLMEIRRSQTAVELTIVPVVENSRKNGTQVNY